MGPWIAVAILLITINVVLNCKSTLKRETKIAFYIITTIILFLFLFFFRAFRSKNVGGDLEEYEMMFNYICNWTLPQALTISKGYEPGWVILNKFLSLFSKDFQIVMIVVALITTISFFWFSFRYSPDPYLTLFIYVTLGFWGSSFNNERQALAISILLFSVYYIQKRKFLRFLILVLLATSIHLTSIVFLITYFIYGYKYKKEYLFVSAIIGFTCFLFAEPLINFVIQLIPFYSRKYTAGEWESSGGFGYLLMLVLVCLVSLLLYPKKSNRKQDLFFYMIVVAAILQVFSLKMPFIQRLVKTFSIAMIITVPYMISNCNPNSRLVAKTVVIVGLFAFYVVGLVNDTISLVPYETMFNPSIPEGGLQ